MNSFLNIPGLLIGAWLATACSGVLTSNQPPRQEFLLMPLTASEQTAPNVFRAELQLTVSAVPGLDTDRVLALEPDARLVQYANARWPDHLPEVLTSVMRRSLLAGEVFSAGGSTQGRDPGVWRVDLEVQSFFGIRDAAGATRSVEVAFSGSVHCGGQRQQLSLKAPVTVTEERLAAVVAAHQAGLDKVSRELVKQLAALCS